MVSTRVTRMATVAFSSPFTSWTAQLMGPVTTSLFFVPVATMLFQALWEMTFESSAAS